uniref:Uncharacterized protein n=1 Tax=Panagrellus redivivus TaxID=6233 RepID=A0A7E4W6B6_PANRE
MNESSDGDDRCEFTLILFIRRRRQGTPLETYLLTSGSCIAMLSEILEINRPSGGGPDVEERGVPLSMDTVVSKNLGHGLKVARAIAPTVGNGWCSVVQGGAALRIAQSVDGYGYWSSAAPNSVLPGAGLMFFAFNVSAAFCPFLKMFY